MILMGLVICKWYRWRDFVSQHLRLGHGGKNMPFTGLLLTNPNLIVINRCDVFDPNLGVNLTSNKTRKTYILTFVFTLPLARCYETSYANREVRYDIG